MKNVFTKILKKLLELSFKVSIYLEEGIKLFSHRDCYLLQLLFPKVFHAIVFLQRKFRKRMAEYDQTKSQILLIHEKSREIWMKPSGAFFFRSLDWSFHLQPGYHIVIYCPNKKIYHHGIYVGGNEIEKSVIHCNMSKPAISYCSLNDFVQGYPYFCYIQQESYKINGFNEDTVQMAKCFIELPWNHILQNYDILKWNCECFSLACMTRGLCFQSEQVKKVWKEMNQNLDYEVSVMAVAVGYYTVQSYLSCSLM